VPDFLLRVESNNALGELPRLVEAAPSQQVVG
jgi:hypothetical protein